MVYRDNRYPRITAMATVALGCRWNMVRGFAGCNDIVVTTGTGSKHLRVIHRVGCNRCPKRREFLMTGVTQVGGTNMRRGFTTGIGAIVTGTAIPGKRAVINRRRYPLRGAVAIITFQCGRNMRCTLANCNHIIVATRAHTIHFVMIYIKRRGP